MGVYASSFHNSGGKIILESTDPSQSNWITLHADTCKMSIPEVQRCWSRFLMLDADTNGNIQRTCLFSKNSFAKQLLEKIPLGNDEVITFQTYCSAVSWLSKAPQESKLRGLYQTLTSSNLTEESLQSLLHSLYPNEDSKCIVDLCHLLLSEIDNNNKGAIDEDQFVSWIQAMPQAHAASLLHFPIIPPDLESSSEPGPSSVSTTAVLDDRWRLRDDQLRHVAMVMAKRKRDWRLLANNLGFLEKDCIFFEAHPVAKDQILDMLLLWRNAFANQTQSQSLQEALKRTGNADIVNEIFSLNF
ncbi:uncharacterized protein LOC142470750 [Ascaphus truei]|uniref:uncharacterized protein LOC142470750 n=1 Tax=Ascaphus truei TaxID=8439 RepID=UPI003F5A803E